MSQSLPESKLQNFNSRAAFAGGECLYVVTSSYQKFLFRVIEYIRIISLFRNWARPGSCSKVSPWSVWVPSGHFSHNPKIFEQKYLKYEYVSIWNVILILIRLILLFVINSFKKGILSINSSKKGWNIVNFYQKYRESRI